MVRKGRPPTRSLWPRGQADRALGFAAKLVWLDQAPAALLAPTRLDALAQPCGLYHLP